MNIEIGKVYKTLNGDIHRVAAVHSFDGVNHYITECIDLWNRTSVLSVAQFNNAAKVDASEWTDALKRVAKAKAQEAKKAQAKLDAEQYGVSVRVVGGIREDHSDTVKIVRCTPARYVDSTGKQYSRENGVRTGGYYHITEDSMELLEAIVGKRAKVDITAERKKAQTQP